MNGQICLKKHSGNTIDPLFQCKNKTSRIILLKAAVLNGLVFERFGDRSRWENLLIEMLESKCFRGVLCIIRESRSAHV